MEKNEGLNSPPREIVEEGKKAVRDYLTTIYKEQKLKIKPKYQFEAKLLLIGEGEVGKTSLRKKLENAAAKLPDAKDRTYGVEITPLNFYILQRFKDRLTDLNQDKLHVKCWDFGGQKIYHGTHQIFFNEETCYVFVADKAESALDFHYWFNTIELYAGRNAQVFVVMNQKYGFKEIFPINEYDSIFPFIKDHSNLDLCTEYDESDPQEGQVNRQKNAANIEQIIDLQGRIISKIHDLPFIGKPLSATYVDIRDELNRIDKNFINFSDFIKICTDHGLTISEVETISKYFNRIGAITHFYDDDFLRERVYLNSDWLVKIIYKVLRDETVEKKKGRIDLCDFDHIWKKDELDFEIKHLTAIMDKFGLMYQIPNTQRFIVPEHLPSGKPYSKWEHESKNECLKFRYMFDNYMPEGMMCHLIVALHTYIVNHENVWKLGVNIEYEGNTFAEIVDSKGRFNYFEIKITGVRRKELLDVIRLKFKEITKRFKKLPFEEEVPCNCPKCNNSLNPFYHQYKDIQSHQDEKKKHVYCNIAKELVPINKVLGQIENIKEEEMKEKIGKHKIFISYCSKDRDLRLIFEEALKINLASSKHQFDSIWSDVAINAGDDWNEKIQTALQESTIGILLVSPAFLHSKYCMGEEFSSMLDRRKKEGYKIFPVLLKKCKFTNNEELAKLQFVKTYKSEYGINKAIEKDEIMPFNEIEHMGDSFHLDNYFFKVADEIDKALN